MTASTKNKINFPPFLILGALVYITWHAIVAVVSSEIFPSRQDPSPFGTIPMNGILSACIGASAAGLVLISASVLILLFLEAKRHQNVEFLGDTRNSYIVYGLTGFIVDLLVIFLFARLTLNRDLAGSFFWSEVITSPQALITAPVVALGGAMLGVAIVKGYRASVQKGLILVNGCWWTLTSAYIVVAIVVLASLDGNLYPFLAFLISLPILLLILGILHWRVLKNKFEDVKKYPSIIIVSLASLFSLATFLFSLLYVLGERGVFY